MTHDELLAYINKEIDQAAWTKEYYPFKSLQALRAVAELHKPKIEIMENDYGQKETFTWCIECPDDEFPCRTIQAIEKELRHPLMVGNLPAPRLPDGHQPTTTEIRRSH